MAGSHHIDHATIATLREVMEGEFAHLIETFINDGKDKIQLMQKALASGLSDELRRAAHSLKGSSSNIGADELVRLCRLIEDQAASDRLQGIETQLIELQQEYHLVKEQLDIYL